MLLSLYEHNPHSMKRTALIILHTVMVVVISNKYIHTRVMIENQKGSEYVSIPLVLERFV